MISSIFCRVIKGFVTLSTIISSFLNTDKSIPNIAKLIKLANEPYDTNGKTDSVEFTIPRFDKMYNVI